MKRVLIAISAVLLTVISASAQVTLKYDTIITINNDTIIAKISDYSVADGIIFTYPDETMSNHFGKLDYKKIILSNGRVVEEYTTVEVPNGDNLWERQVLCTDSKGQYVGKAIITVEADIADSFNENIVKCKTRNECLKVADTHLRYAYAAYKTQRYPMAAKGVDAIEKWYSANNIGSKDNSIAYHINRINKWLAEAGYTR